MNSGPNQPSGQEGNPSRHGGKGRRRRRGHRGHGGPQQPGGQPHGQQQGQGQGQGQGPSQGRNRPHPGANRPRKHRQRPGKQRPAGQHPAGDVSIYSAPMDHSYRLSQQNGNGNVNANFRGRGPQPGYGKQFMHTDPEPLPAGAETLTPRIYAFVDDLFFVAKINETARKLNVKIEFVKSDKDVLDKIESNGDQKPSLIIFDLNSGTAKPLTTIPKLKTKLKKDTHILGFLSHVQGELKLKAQEAGCDTVIPRSAFSQNLPQLLRRHGAPDDLEEIV